MFAGSAWSFGSLRPPGRFPWLCARDASGEWTASVRAPLKPEVVQEMARFSLKKGTWSRLLPLGELTLEKKDFFSLMMSCLLRGLLLTPFGALWLHLCNTRNVGGADAEGHINVHELRAFLIEEKRVARECRQKRVLSGLDSQVALGSLVKGRSASSPLNKLLRTNLCHPLGSGIFNYYMYFLSEENRADGPTRNSEPKAPDKAVPQWLVDLQAGDFVSFEKFLCSLPADQQLNPFDFTSLMTGKNLDVRPRSRLHQKERKRSSLPPAKKIAAAVADPSPCFDPSTVDILKSFDLQKFFYVAECPDFPKPGGLDLFSGNFAVAKQMLQHGAPWILSFDWNRSAKEKLLFSDVRECLLKLVAAGWLLTVGLAPICASFSPAITPPVRSKGFLRGKPGVSLSMRRKLSEGNPHADFSLVIINLCTSKGIAYFCENPDRSWLWQQKGYEQFSAPNSPSLFRLSFCRFGTA